MVVEVTLLLNSVVCPSSFVGIGIVLSISCFNCVSIVTQISDNDSLRSVLVFFPGFSVTVFLG